MLSSRLNKIMRYPEKIPADKRLHFMVGTVYMMVFSFLPIPVVSQIMLLVILAYGIEFYQKFTKSGTYDNWDAIAVVLGGLPVIIPILVKGL